MASSQLTPYPYAVLPPSIAMRSSPGSFGADARAAIAPHVVSGGAFVAAVQIDVDDQQPGRR